MRQTAEDMAKQYAAKGFPAHRIASILTAKIPESFFSVNGVVYQRTFKGQAPSTPVKVWESPQAARSAQ